MLRPAVGAICYVLFEIIKTILEIVVVTGCAMHDASKALEWSMHPHIADDEMLKSLHVVVESARNAYDLLVSTMPSFLVQKLHRVHEPYDREEVAAWWRSMGAGADWVDTLVDVNPIFHNGQLKVSHQAGGVLVSAALVGDCLLYIMKLSKFCETRWCTVGNSCRALVASLSVGLYELAIMALATKGSVDSKLNGIKKLGQGVKWYAAVASIVTVVPEAFELEVAQDDRLLRRIEELELVLLDELEYVHSLPDLVWKRLAWVAKSALRAEEMKQDCILAAQTSVGFIANRFFS